MALDPELMKKDKIQIIKLPPERWKDYRTLRLRALKDDPQAFGRSYSEEVAYSNEKWREKTNDNILFASDGNNLIGMMGTYQSDVDKENKTANVFGVYVVPEFRGKGISKMLMQALLDGLKSNPGISKLKLTVNKNQLSAVKLYETFGFITMKEEKALLGDGNYYSVVLHSFAHLSESKSSPEFAQKLIEGLKSSLEERNIVTRVTPYGYFLEFKIHILGESLAKVFKSF